MGPEDPGAFQKFDQNVTVGPVGAESYDAAGNALPRANCAVFRDRNSNHLGTLTISDIKKVLNNLKNQ